MELLAKYRFDGGGEVSITDDLIFFESHGGMTLEAAQQLLELFRLMHEKHGQFFLLVDLTDGGGVPAEVRRLLAKNTVTHAPAAVALYGASLAVRGSNALMIAAVRLIGGPSQNITYRETAEEAHEWLAAERKRLAAP